MWSRLYARPLWQKTVAGAALFFATLVLLDLAFPPPVGRVETSVVITGRDGQWLHGFTIEEGGERRWRLAASLEDIDPFFVERLIAIEDKRFYEHWGVDPAAVIRATGSMIRHRKIVSGASTITMQTARLLEPRPRTIPSKLIEMIRAVQLERRYSKDEILELYLTLAPYGGNLEGVRAASLAWFGKEPARLTDAQQALLIALPQAPEARRPDRRPQTATTARNRILEKLAASGMVSETAAEEAQIAPVPDARRPFRRLAWHAAFEARAGKPGGEYALTLTAPLQEVVERHLENAADGLKDKANLAAIIVENDTLEIRALAGSADLSLAGGWIDMTAATRSPGSTLKPFIYGLAFDDGLAGTETLIDDAARSFGGYTPENFNRLFHGDVTVSEALQHSLNVPAVLVLDQIGPQRFAAMLQASGVDTDLPAGADRKASLAIALGGLGVTMRDLAMLYAGLANGGIIEPIILQPAEDNPTGGYRLLTAASADRLARIMREAPAPEGRVPAVLAEDAPPVAFKTGTSYGYRDAWAAGFTDQFTIIVWAGHANGTPRTGITGREAALSLLFDLFDLAGQHLDPTRAQEKSLPGEVPFAEGGALARLGGVREELPPEIVFPQDGVELYFSGAVAARGFSFSARGGAGGYEWYVDGLPVSDGGNRPIWHPPGPGFYKVTVVDAAGRQSRARIAVKSAS